MRRVLCQAPQAPGFACARLTSVFERGGGFTLPELVVVMGLMMVLFGLTMPAVSKAWRQAEAVTCRSQLRQLGLALAVYANDNHGVVIPMVPGSWPRALFDEPMPAVLVCPSWDEPFMSYQLNGSMSQGFKISGGNARGLPASRIPLAGESRAGCYDEITSYDYFTNTISWDPVRHGPGLMANYLWLDFHVDNGPLPTPVPPTLDPWYIASR